MDFSINLYSEDNYSPVEEKQNERRFVIACILAILLHIGLFIAFGMSDLFNHKRPEEVKIINVQLHNEITSTPAAPKAQTKQTKRAADKPKPAAKPQTTKQTQVKQTAAKPETTKAKPAQTKQNQSKTETAKNAAPPQEKPAQSEPVTKQISDTKSAVPPQNLPTAKPSAETKPQTADKTEEAPVTEEPDFFEQMTKAADAHAADTKQQWADAHKAAEAAETAEDAAARDLINNINAASAAKQTADANTAGGETGSPDNQTASDTNNISWASGSSRKLLSAGTIEPPEEIALLGLKTTVTIRFEVFPNGLIGAVEITESSGSSEWDNIIAQQFKTNYKFAQASGVAVGTISIAIGY